MRRIFLCILFFILSSTWLLAQQNDTIQRNPFMEKKPPKKGFTQNFYFGGNFNFTIGNYTSIGVWPLIGYKATPKLSFGLQPGYEYLKYDRVGGGSFETSNYGIRTFTRYRIIPEAYAHVEYAAINYESWDNERIWVPFLFVGGGYTQQIGGNTFAYVQLLFDVINNENSPYRSGEPFWSIGIIAGF
jgi:hypothetical protein